MLNDLRKENEELKETVDSLKKQIAQLRSQLLQYKKDAARKYRQEFDYLPYDDDERR